jgi:anti-sigma-K factor RskA
MSACKQWKEQLIEAALGEKLSHEFETHLKTCADCSVALADTKARAARLDAAVTELSAMPAPSAGFDARLSERIAENREKGSWSGWLWEPQVRMRIAAVGVICAAVVGVTAGPKIYEEWHGQRMDQPVVTISTWRSPTESLLHTPDSDLLTSTPKVGEPYFALDVKEPRNGR